MKILWIYISVDQYTLFTVIAPNSDLFFN